MRQIKHGFLSFSLLVLAAVNVNAETGETAPGFALPDASGKVVSLQDYAGQVLLINFWASWCDPCREEMPLLDQLSQRYGSLGFTMLGINIEEDSSLADRFLQGTPVGFPILYDRENAVSELYDVIALPTTVLVDRQGNIRFVHHGYETGNENEYQDQIRTLVRE